MLIYIVVFLCYSRFLESGQARGFCHNNAMELLKNADFSRGNSDLQAALTSATAGLYPIYTDADLEKHRAKSNSKKDEYWAFLSQPICIYLPGFLFGQAPAGR